MKNGLAIIARDEVETKAVFIDQDVIECARLNALTKKRVAKAEAELKEALRKQRKEEIAKAKRTEYTLKTVGYLLIRGGIICAAAYGLYNGMIHPLISLPVMLFCLCASCIRFGVWFGKRVRNGR